MLVLSRKCGERIQVGEDIVITVTRCGRNRVVLGIDAPSEVPIRRFELGQDSEKSTSRQGTQSASPLVAARNS